ncbi:MAG TPA: MFS transporter [Tepidisphaeraceae bacterium]|jgi:MFS family permease|nr:MFS transporter [Tepidisphaeraceae bacterium]
MSTTLDSPVSESKSAGGMSFMLRALQYRNYRLFFMGQGVSLIGSWLTTTATAWLVYRLALGNPLLKAAMVLGVVRFAAQIPTFLVAPIAGVMVDRWNRHRVIVVTQILSMLQSAVLAFLALSGKITIAEVVGLNFFQGFVNAFDAPARQAFVVEMVERIEDLPNAIALNSSMFNGARLLGPAVAGLLIAATSEGVCFLIDAISYFAVIIALLLMSATRPVKKIERKHPLHELREGFRYAFGFPPVRAILLLGGLTSISVSAFQTLMPMFVEDLAPASHGAKVFGFLGTAVGVGALAGAIYLASRRTVIGLGRIMAAAGVFMGVAMAWFAITKVLWLAMIMAAFTGLGTIIAFAAGNTMLQALVDDEMRGRLMAFYIMAVMGTAPVGSIIAGWVAVPERLGKSMTVQIAGAISVLAAVLFMMKMPQLRALVRPIYVRKGIIPEVAQGLQQASEVTTPPEQ